MKKALSLTLALAVCIALMSGALVPLTALISPYARQSVYFMFANGIISGTGNNNFSPRAASTAEQAISISSATREQALAIAVRMVDKLKDVPLDYE